MTAVIDAKFTGRWWLWRWVCWHTSGIGAGLRLILCAVDHAGRAYAAKQVERWHVEDQAVTPPLLAITAGPTSVFEECDGSAVTAVTAVSDGTVLAFRPAVVHPRSPLGEGRADEDFLAGAGGAGVRAGAYG